MSDHVLEIGQFPLYSRSSVKEIFFRFSVIGIKDDRGVMDRVRIRF